jgi:hypothetical protein
MTEADWEACQDPAAMLEYLRGRTSERKMRLFAVACCRRIWGILEAAQAQQAVLVAEQYADGAAPANALDAACRDAAWHISLAYERRRPTAHLRAAAETASQFWQASALAAQVAKLVSER